MTSRHLTRLSRPGAFFPFAMTGAALVAAAGIWCGCARFAAAHSTAEALAEKRAELRRLHVVRPALTPESAAAIEADLARAQATLAAMQTELAANGPAAARLARAKVPTARPEAYFDLATFAERMRALARKHGVELGPEALRFGFSAYASAGPEAARIEPVFRQRQVVEHIVETLLEAQPSAVLAVKRERPVSRGEQDGTTRPPENGPDFFTLDPRASVRVPGAVATAAYRVTFTGQSGTLRTFLTRLASFELPVIIRDVEVEPASPAAPAARATSEERRRGPVAASVVLTVDGAMPGTETAGLAVSAVELVRPVYSKFTVTMEHLGAP